MQTISTHTTAIEAHILKGRLEAEGIRAYVVFENHIWADWPLSVALGGVRVQVPMPYHQEALHIINDVQAGEYESVLEALLPSTKRPTCPNCGGETSPVRWSAKVALLIVYLLAIPVPYSHHKLRCVDCRNSWVATVLRAYPLYIHAFSIFMIFCVVWALVSIGGYLCTINCERSV